MQTLTARPTIGRRHNQEGTGTTRGRRGLQKCGKTRLKYDRTSAVASLDVERLTVVKLMNKFLTGIADY